MKLLLHICCAPCLIYPLQRLRAKGFSITGFFYNPNIHPLSEYENRKLAVIGLSEAENLDCLYPEYAPSEFFRGTNLMEDKPQRCPICWYLRLKSTAKLAKEREFEHFSTTLLVSPYQDLDALNRIGGDIAREEGVNFYYEDFRDGFRKAHQTAKAQGIYCQKYCGCIYSELERCKK